LPQRTRSQVPSLHEHYPASAVLRTCPPPLGGPVCPSRASGWITIHRWGFPCCVRSPCAHMPSPIPRWDRRRDRVAPLEPATAAFPVIRAGRLPHCDFRGLLGVHLRYGLCARGVAETTLSIEGFGSIVASTAAPIATGWSDLCRVGMAPTEDRRLFTAHRITVRAHTRLLRFPEGV